ncbi:MAG: hypothetical protein ACE5NA_07550 [Nitrospiraceae bacterium]
MVRWPRQIMFGDVDAMFASAAIVANPSLAGKLVAVGNPPPRGIITAASYAARRHGVAAAMPTAHALRLCPDLTLVPPDRPLYQRLHERMRTVTDRFFPTTEWTSIDEFYAESTDLQSIYPDPLVLARGVKEAIVEMTGLRCTLAVATGKTVAKVAADCHKPDGLVVISPGTEAAFLAPQPVGAIPGIGPKTSAELDRIGIHSIGDLLDARFEPMLRRRWGSRLLALQSLARGVDTDAVVRNRDHKSLGHESTFDQDTDDVRCLERTVRSFLSDLSHDLRMEGLAARAFVVKLKDSQFKVTTRQRRFSRPLNYDPAMWPEIRAALRSLTVLGTRYRLVGLSFSGLCPATADLYEQRSSRAVAAMDTIIERHGSRIMRLGETPREN